MDKQTLAKQFVITTRSFLAEDYDVEHLPYNAEVTENGSTTVVFSLDRTRSFYEQTEEIFDSAWTATGEVFESDEMLLLDITFDEARGVATLTLNF